MRSGKRRGAESSGESNVGAEPADAADTDADRSTGPAYFDMGENWEKLKAKYELTNEDMFDAFVMRFLDDQVGARKPVRFAQDPLADTGILGRQLEYLLRQGYIYESSALVALPPRPVAALRRVSRDGG